MSEILLTAQRFVVEMVDRVLPDGSKFRREIIRHTGAVVVLPILDDGRVCLLRSFRPSVDRYLWELPAGTLDRGEDPTAAAVRELAEETGYRAGTVKHIHTFCASPGIMDELMHFYVASNLQLGHPAREVGEVMENHLFTWQEIDRMLAEWEIVDSKTLVALLWYLRFKHIREERHNTSSN